MNISKKTAFGATAAAAALIVVGAAAPAMASDTDYSSYAKNSARTSTSHQTTNTVVNPDIDALGGDILNGNVLGSDNEVNAPLLSGNDTAIGNGNETAVGNVTGNTVENDVTDLVDNGSSSTVTDLVDVDGILGDVTGSLGLSGIFED